MLQAPGFRASPHQRSQLTLRDVANHRSASLEVGGAKGSLGVPVSQALSLSEKRVSLLGGTVAPKLAQLCGARSGWAASRLHCQECLLRRKCSLPHLQPGAPRGSLPET